MKKLREYYDMVMEAINKMLGRGKPPPKPPPPTSNTSISNVTTPVQFKPTSDPYIDGVLTGTKWGSSSVPIIMTYSFPQSAELYIGLFGGPYGAGEAVTGFRPFNAIQEAAIDKILSWYAEDINMIFVKIVESSTNSAKLRFAYSTKPSTAWGYYPSSSNEGGDCWFNAGGLYDNPVIGNYAWKAMSHEVGHALGLKHPHDTVGAFGAMPLDRDCGEFTYMSYKSHVGSNGSYTNEYGGYPQTPMMYDLAALQFMYGPNYKTHIANTVWSWDPDTGETLVDGVGRGIPSDNRVCMTIWDGGGTDTIDLSNYVAPIKNTSPGSWSITAPGQLSYLGDGVSARGNVFNALDPKSFIEN